MTTQPEEAAELLESVRHHQRRTRRTLGFGWLLAASGGVVMLIGIALNAAGVSPRLEAVITGLLVMGIGFVALRLARHNEERFDVSLPPGLIVGGLAGVAVSTAGLALLTDGEPLAVGPMLGAAIAIALNGVILLRFSPDSPPWVGRLMVATGVLIAIAVLVAPDSYGPRRVIGAAALLGYAAYAWWRSGRTV